MGSSLEAGRRLKVVVGITGGIAAYKAVGVVRALVLAEHDVHVVATEAALRFVGKPTLEAISRNPVHTELYEGVAEVRHVAIGQAADLIVIAPATAHTLAKLAAGLADDLLGNTVLASTAPLVVAPAMHTEMWANAATVANTAVLRSRGVHVVGPAVGRLTGADSGPGRMEEPETIVAEALAVHARSASARRDLAGVRVLVTAGGTREPLDPVRFVGNRSSGRQGVALALAAAARGAEVTLLAANLDVPAPEGVTVLPVGTALELREAALAAAPGADVVIMAAAVADYRPASVADAKIKKEQQGDRLVLELVKNPDVLAEISASRREGQIVVGFAAETEPDRDAMLALGRAKIARKGCDLLVLNRVGWAEGFQSDSNAVVVLDRAGDIVGEASGSKAEVADRVLDAVVR
ncbi:MULTISPECIES: bifunctional phosphopantothenoylcysteine decarboxylase/phosphopantothenate--cysteine ligase CoaBC [unclassified Rathayibacter]|uniref:bifunctional phosphopantothenoylcysteine decarboxylase/phosphopantothenate--cysteine ligase CoaBC n=1 Tax=unclassified Rathayibacter TaxID=2609250 RepID=UPI000CE81AAA|nr:MULTISPECIES: bifunctional phosphopantothenoylcysteine decarboxylase/phosphopantothenate--cysteine ligase CoaBC [unclassified Rathayibacter]PPG60113.1 bifunctional phosphopantothenoylcysteine decarboxylase/phosphopantothenate--cysteine ligase CoaBC [Rathayibacter sp. AY1C7]PPH54522.1 bifunctional phosphopantothenoylcysteine decarboxylase/phosphopantothenate--cysteine ligase CoaBC [Rathayibacter sp. AY1E1]PPH91697.1 bifunctional phosphopantothenoylcysteine decarboxylase/phosphopantothenate--cy